MGVPANKTVKLIYRQLVTTRWKRNKNAVRFGENVGSLALVLDNFLEQQKGGSV